MFLLILIPLFFETASLAQGVSQRLYRFQKNGLWGFINTKSDTLIKAQWEKVENFYNDRALVMHKGKWGMINMKGDYLIPPAYEEIGEVSKDGIAVVVKENLAGYININTASIISSLQWNRAYPFNGGYAKVGKNNLYGIINSKGIVVCPVEYTEIVNVSDGMIKIEKNKKCGFLDSTANIVIPVIWSYARDFKEGYSVVETENGNYGFMDKSGKLVIELPEGVRPSDLQEGLSGVVKNNKTGFMDLQGKMIIPFQWDNAFLFHRGYAAVQRHGKWGFINKRGDVVIDLAYDEILPFSDGTADGKKNDKWEKINFGELASDYFPPPVEKKELNLETVIARFTKIDSRQLLHELISY